MRRHKTVDDYIDAQDQWHDELVKLRNILNSTPLEEEVKWGGPCYTYRSKLLVGIGAFKSHFALWFHQGALLEDPQDVLINAQEGKTKALRQWRFESGKEIKTRTIKAYVKEAIALVEQGREIKPARKKAIPVPTLLKSALAKNKKAAAGFGALTPGKQREYIEYIESAKREETKRNRLEKILPMLAAGKGLNDKYRGG